MKMKINSFILMFLVITCNYAYSQSISEILSGTTEYNTVLSDNEKQALKIVNEWTKGNRVSPITRGNNGEIEMIYGLSQPQILTAILQVTDIQFEPGETITSAHVGDTARWVIEHIKASTRYGIQEHIIVKPKDTNLLTSLIVVTDKRTYHLRLKSNDKLYYPMVKFHYPANLILKTQDNIPMQKTGNITLDDITTGSYLKDLNFNYKIKGSANFKPVRVYNDGTKTVIELPNSIKANNIPLLMTIEPESKKPVIVNYRFQKNKFIVDAVFDKAILISGVGQKQKKITLIREK